MLRRTLSGMRQTPGLFLVCVLSVALSVFLVGAFAWSGVWLSRWTQQLLGTSTAVLYLNAVAGDSEAAQIRARLLGDAQVLRAEVITKAEAASELTRLLGNDSPPLAALTTYSVEVTTAPAHVTEKRGEWLTWPYVDEVDLGEVLVERAHSLERIISIVSSAGLMLVLGAAGFVVYITMSLCIWVRREALQIERIVGAGDFFVAAPLILESAVAALIGGAVAVGLLQFTIRVSAKRLVEMLAALELSPPMPLGSHEQWLLLAAGVFLAVGAALVAVSRHLFARESL